MPGKDPGHARTHDLGGGDVVLAELGQDVRADYARELGGVDDGGRQDDHRHYRQARGHGQHQDRRQGDAGEGHEDVEDAHDDLADPLAAGRGNSAQDGGQGQGDARGAQADDQ